MKVKLLSLAIVMAMISTVGSRYVLARAATEPRPSGEESRALPESVPSVKETSGQSAKLRGDMQKLLADAKAGKVAPRPRQFPNTGRNNLSTGAKIGIAAAIAGVIFALIVIHQVNSDDD